MALTALLVYSIISCVDNCWLQFPVPFWHSIRTFLVGILHKLGHNFFIKFLHYIWELVQHGGVVACRIVPIHASGSTSLFTQTGLNTVAHSGHNQNMTANAFFVDDSPRSVQTEWYQVPHFGFEHEIQLGTSSAPSCCLHDYTIDIFSTVPAVWRVFHLWYLIYLNIHVGKVRLWVSYVLYCILNKFHACQIWSLSFKMLRPWKLAIRIVVRPKPRMFREESLGSELFRIGSVHEFYRLKALITLEQVNTSVIKILLSLDQQD